MVAEKKINMVSEEINMVAGGINMEAEEIINVDATEIKMVRTTSFHNESVFDASLLHGIILFLFFLQGKFSIKNFHNFCCIL